VQPGDLVVEGVMAPGEPGHALLSAGEVLTAHRLETLGDALAHLAPDTNVTVDEAPEGSRAGLRL